MCIKGWVFYVIWNIDEHDFDAFVRLTVDCAGFLTLINQPLLTVIFVYVIEILN